MATESRLRVEIPYKLSSPGNRRGENGFKRSKRVKHERGLVMVHLLSAGLRRAKNPPASRKRLTFTRVAPRPLDAHDNLRAAFKAMVDETVAHLGYPDDSDRQSIEVVYTQEKPSKPRTYLACITIEDLDDDA